jgi:hypothetical protein
MNGLELTRMKKPILDHTIRAFLTSENTTEQYSLKKSLTMLWMMMAQKKK